MHLNVCGDMSLLYSQTYC